MLVRGDPEIRSKMKMRMKQAPKPMHNPILRPRNSSHHCLNKSLQRLISMMSLIQSSKWVRTRKRCRDCRR
jgi:hypothetical protein